MKNVIVLRKGFGELEYEVGTAQQTSIQRGYRLDNFKLLVKISPSIYDKRIIVEDFEKNNKKPKVDVLDRNMAKQLEVDVYEFARKQAAKYQNLENLELIELTKPAPDSPDKK